MQLAHGVTVEPSTPYHDQDVTIKYDGLLYQSGADQVYLHFGMDGWRNPATVPMMRESAGFYAMVRASGEREIDFCFHDSAKNWDNNNGLDWSIPIY